MRDFCGKRNTDAPDAILVAVVPENLVEEAEKDKPTKKRKNDGTFEVHLVLYYYYYYNNTTTTLNLSIFFFLKKTEQVLKV